MRYKCYVLYLQIIDHGPPNELQRREGYWQHELMTLQPWGLNIRDELNGGAGEDKAWFNATNLQVL